MEETRALYVKQHFSFALLHFFCKYVLKSFGFFFQHIERPYSLIEEDPQNRRLGPAVRVEKMFEQIMSKLPGPPQFLLCVLPERKNSDIYGNEVMHSNFLSNLKILY